MKGLTLYCDIYHKNTKVGRLEVDNGVLIKNAVFTRNILLHPFPCSKVMESVLSGLEDRVICRKRCDRSMRYGMGIREYNILDILKNTHGVDVDDFIWFKFDDDKKDLSWDEVKVRG